MFIRFTTDQLDDDTAMPVGIFTVAYRLIECPCLTQYQLAEIENVLQWFRVELPIPSKFSRSIKRRCDDRGICWFKSSASICIQNARYLAYLVSEHDVVVNELSTKIPGYLVYEDEFQVVAEPFSNTLS
jgi:hypothetical protein